MHLYNHPGKPIDSQHAAIAEISDSNNPAEPTHVNTLFCRPMLQFLSWALPVRRLMPVCNCPGSVWFLQSACTVPILMSPCLSAERSGRRSATG